MSIICQFVAGTAAAGFILQAATPASAEISRAEKLEIVREVLNEREAGKKYFIADKLTPLFAKSVFGDGLDYITHQRLTMYTYPARVIFHNDFVDISPEIALKAYENNSFKDSDYYNIHIADPNSSKEAFKKSFSIYSPHANMGFSPVVTYDRGIRYLLKQDTGELCQWNQESKDPDQERKCAPLSELDPDSELAIRIERIVAEQRERERSRQKSELKR